MYRYESLSPQSDYIDCSHIEILIPDKNLIKEKISQNPYELQLALLEYLPEDTGCVHAAELFIDVDRTSHERVIIGTIAFASNRLKRRAHHIIDDVAELLADHHQRTDIEFAGDNLIYVNMGLEGNAQIKVSQTRPGNFLVTSSLDLTRTRNSDEDYEIIRRQAELWGDLQDRLASIDGSVAQMKSITIGPQFLEFPPEEIERVYLGIIASNQYFNDLASPRLGTVNFMDIDVPSLLEQCPGVSYEEAYGATSLAIQSLRAKSGETPRTISQLDIIKEVERLRFAPQT